MVSRQRKKIPFKHTKNVSLHKAYPAKLYYIRHAISGRYVRSTTSNIVDLENLQTDDDSFKFSLKTYRGVERDISAIFYGESIPVQTFWPVTNPKYCIGTDQNQVKLIPGKVYVEDKGGHHLLIENPSHNVFTYRGLENNNAVFLLTDPGSTHKFLAGDKQKHMLFARDIKSNTFDRNLLTDDMLFQLEPVSSERDDDSLSSSCSSLSSCDSIDEADLGPEVVHVKPEVVHVKPEVVHIGINTETKTYHEKAVQTDRTGFSFGRLVRWAKRYCCCCSE